MSNLVSAATITVDAKTTNKRINIVTDYSKEELTTASTSEEQYTNFITHLDISDIAGRKGHVDLLFPENNTSNDRTDCVLVKAGNPSMTVGKLELTQLAPVGNYFKWGVSSNSVEWNDTSLRNTYQTTYTSVSFEKDSEWITIDEYHTGKTDFVIILSPYEAQNVQPRVGKVIAKNGNTTVGTWTITQNSKTQYSFNWTSPSNTVESTGTTSLFNSYENTYPNPSFESSDTWIDIKNTGATSFEISVSENVEGSQRTGYVKAKSGDDYISTGTWTIQQAGSGPTPTKSFNWTQARTPSVSPDGGTVSNKYNNSYSAGEIKFITDDDWITITGQTAQVGSDISYSVNVGKNIGEARTGYVYAKYNDSVIDTWKIQQNPGSSPSGLHFRFVDDYSSTAMTTAVTAFIATVDNISSDIGVALTRTNYGLVGTEGGYVDTNDSLNFTVEEGGECLKREDGKYVVKMGPQQGTGSEGYMPQIIFFLEPNNTSSSRKIKVKIEGREEGDWGTQGYAEITITQLPRQAYYFVWEYDGYTGGTPEQQLGQDTYIVDHTTTENSYAGLAQDYVLTYADYAAGSYGVDFTSNIFMSEALGTSNFTLTAKVLDEDGNVNTYVTDDGNSWKESVETMQDVHLTIGCRESGKSLQESDKGRLVLAIPENNEVKSIGWQTYKNCSKVYNIYLNITYYGGGTQSKLPGTNNSNRYDSNSYFYWTYNWGIASDVRDNFMRWRLIQKPNKYVLTAQTTTVAEFGFVEDGVVKPEVNYTVSASTLYNSSLMNVGFGIAPLYTKCDFIRDHYETGKGFVKGEFIYDKSEEGGIVFQVISGVTNEGISEAFFGHNTSNDEKSGSVTIKYLGPSDTWNSNLVSANTVSKYWNWKHATGDTGMIPSTKTITQEANPFTFDSDDHPKTGHTFTWCNPSNVEIKKIVPSISFIRQIPTDTKTISSRLNFATKYISPEGKHELSFECYDGNGALLDEGSNDRWLEFYKVGEPTDTYDLYNCKTSLSTRQWKEGEEVVEYDARHISRKGRGVVKHGDAEVGEVNVLQIAPGTRNVTIKYPTEYKIQMIGNVSDITGATMELNVVEMGDTESIVKYTGTITEGTTTLQLVSQGSSTYSSDIRLTETGRILMSFNAIVTIDKGTATGNNPTIRFTDTNWITYNGQTHVSDDFNFDTKTEFMYVEPIPGPPLVDDGEHKWIKWDPNDKERQSGIGDDYKYRLMYRDENLPEGAISDDYYGRTCDTYDFTYNILSKQYDGTIQIV